MRIAITLIYLFLMALPPTLAAGGQESQAPGAFQIIQTDLDRFKTLIRDWSKWSPEEKMQHLKTDYQAQGSIGLDQFYQRKIRDNQRFAATIDDLLPHYQTLAAYDMDLQALRPGVAQMYARYQELFPQSTPIDVYFLVGRMSSAGTVSPQGVLIGMEHFVTQIPDQPGKYKYKQMGQLLRSVAHEYCHALQDQAGPPTLIRCALFEGGADFMAELTTGISPAVSEHYLYGLAHQEEVWRAFQKEMWGTDISNWKANRRREDWPADMAYYMGYQLAKAFYHNMPDKALAAKHLTEVKDAAYILKIGRYGEHFPSTGN